MNFLYSPATPKRKGATRTNVVVRRGIIRILCADVVLDIEDDEVVEEEEVELLHDEEVTEVEGKVELQGAPWAGRRSTGLSTPSVPSKHLQRLRPANKQPKTRINTHIKTKTHQNERNAAAAAPRKKVRGFFLLLHTFLMGAVPR
jgi:hypothetical protein